MSFSSAERCLQQEFSDLIIQDFLFVLVWVLGFLFCFVFLTDQDG